MRVVAAGRWSRSAGVGRLRAGPVFPSDHTGVHATLSCPTTESQREEATSATVATTSTSTTAPGSVDASTRAAIEEAFHLLSTAT